MPLPRNCCSTSLFPAEQLRPIGEGGPGTREKVSARGIDLEGNTHAQEINVSQLPVWLSLSQLAKALGPSYYCLCSLFNKIRDRGRIVSAGYRGHRGREGGGEGGGKGRPKHCMHV
jgi:hypothetical protein